MGDICVDGTIRRGEHCSSAKGATMVRSVGDGAEGGPHCVIWYL